MAENVITVKENIGDYAHGITVGGSMTTILGGVSLDKMAIVIGLLVTVGGFCVNLLFKILDRRDKLKLYAKLAKDSKVTDVVAV